MDAFDYAYNKTLGLEGEYSDIPGDRGGRTKYGITETTLMEAIRQGLIGAIGIRDLTPEQARIIYKALYWNPLKLQGVKDIAIAAEIFDTAVNSGVKKAVLIAQLALEYLGESINLDGAIGPATLNLINKWCVKDPRALFVALNGIQFIYFCEIIDPYLIDTIKMLVRPNADQRQFARGWTRRIQEYRGAVSC